MESPVIDIQNLFGRLLHTAQMFDSLLQRTSITMDAEAARQFGEALNSISAQIIEQATIIHALMLQHGLERRTPGERRWYTRRCPP